MSWWTQFRLDRGWITRGRKPNLLPLRERIYRRLWGMFHGSSPFSNRGTVKMQGTLSVRVKRGRGEWTDYGIVSRKLVTQAFVKRLAAQMAVDFSAADEWKFHASGTNSTAESNADSALGTEVETRVAGTQSDVSAGTDGNYRTVATVTYTGAHTLREHGVFNLAAAGVLLDRSVFAAITVGAGDSVEYTYTLDILPE